MMKSKRRMLTAFLVVATLLNVAVAGLFMQFTTNASAASIDDLLFTELSDGSYMVKPNPKAGSIVGELIIPSTYNGKAVTAIQNEAFINCTQLTGITIPDSVTSIGMFQFMGCSRLTSVVLGNGITEVSQGTFSGCSSLVRITLGNNVTRIEQNAFNSCTSLTDITLPVCINSIDDRAFDNCNRLVEIKYAGTSAQWNEVTTYSQSYNPDITKIVCLGDIPNVISTGLEDFAYTNDNVEVSFSGYYAQAYYLRSNTGFPSEQASMGFKLGTVFSLEGYYRVEVRNPYAEAVIKYFCIDRTPPTGTLIGVTNGEKTKSNVTFKWTESDVTAKLNGNSYANDSTISAEGNYTIVLIDSAKNSTSYAFTIDKTPPEISGNPQYTNSAFTLTAQDKYSDVKEWEYKLNDGTVEKNSGNSITLGGGENANGVWQIRAYDEIGNCSAWVTVNFAFRAQFGNSDAAYNSYFIPAYYCVTLSQKNYPDSYGTYEFADYDGALSFAKAKEWSCRVIELNGGSEWNYVTVSNENARQIYTDKVELDAAIDKYARKNIGERKIVGRNGATLISPTDDNGVTREDALTSQIKGLPSILTGYSSYRYMLIPAGFSFSAPNSIVDGNKSTVKVKFISDGFSIREGAFRPLEYGDKLSTVVTEQGWYLIEESDVCDNIERYLVYVDLEQPVLHASVTYGNGIKESINFDEAFITENTKAMRYISFDINSLSDNIDDYVMLILEGRGLNAAQYLWGDFLPVLSYENGYSGEYTVTAYDRSLNVLEFVVYIAGEPPTITHTSLTNETSCVFTIRVNDSRNEINSVELYKVMYDGTTERLFEDSTGATVGADNLVYRLTVGGKYVFVITDLYGRVVSTEPIFYLKGLPTATLHGVKDGGVTKNDVRVVFESTCTAELYVFDLGEWVLANLYTIDEGATQKTLSIIAGVETTASYKVLLYVTDDRNLFTEYTFEIDGIPPVVEITTEAGDIVQVETVTTQSFRVSWVESGYTVYYRKGNALSDSTYAKGTLITASGTYTFTVYDSVRNELTFRVTLDNYVTYSLEGSYMTLGDGSLITRNSFIFTMLEPWTSFNVESSNGLIIGNGQKIDTDGTYEINVRDAYGNPLSMTLIVDKLPPVPTVTTESGRVLNGSARINEGFSVSCAEENVNITYSFGSGYVVYDGTLLTDTGTYTFVLTDRVGNSIDIRIVIDKTVEFSINGTYIIEEDGSYLSGSWVSVTLKEEMSDFYIESSDGVRFKEGERISSTGTYNIYMKDISGNEQSLVIRVDKLPPVPTVTTESGIVLNVSARINEGFSVSSNEENVRIVIIIDGVKENYSGEFLRDAGRYEFTLTDRLGNVAELTVIIDRVVAYQINGNYVTDLEGNYISNGWLSISFTEDIEVFSITDEDGAHIDANTRISSVGEYDVYLKDGCGNEASFKLIIDKTPPEIELDGVAFGAATNGTVTVWLDDYAEAYYRLNSSDKKPIESGVIFDKEGSYIVTVSDLVGNSSSVTFEIDRTVKVTPSRDIIDGEIITGAISFEFGEAVTALLYKNDAESTYSRGNITEAGRYALIVTDNYQNVKTFNWTIIAARAIEYSIFVDGYNVNVERDGVYCDAERSGVFLILTQLGKYTLTFNKGGECWELRIEVDNLAPTVQIEITSKSVTIFEPSKENVTYELYRDGKKVNFNFKTRADITKKGNYTLICTDDLGNTMEYVFSINYMSTSTIVLISIAVVLVSAIIIVFFILRFRRRKY